MFHWNNTKEKAVEIVCIKKPRIRGIKYKSYSDNRGKGSVKVNKTQTLLKVNSENRQVLLINHLRQRT